MSEKKQEREVSYTNEQNAVIYEIDFFENQEE